VASNRLPSFASTKDDVVDQRSTLWSEQIASRNSGL
jgi:hypothetical protein